MTLDSAEDNPFASPQVDVVAAKVSRKKPTRLSSDALATRWERLGASLIDLVIILPVVIGLATYFLPMGSNLRHLHNQVVIFLTSMIVSWSYFLLVNGYLLARHGQTVGKYVCGIKIVLQRDYRVPPLGHLLLTRYLAMNLLAQIPWVGGLISLVNVLFIFMPDRRCLHDHLAGTIVVRSSVRGKPGRRSKRAALELPTLPESPVENPAESTAVQASQDG
ncbi:RDD family protein [Blastopirellula marina]|uniref:RDD family protein n=1 Tax=Blastopirellula marina TaxID=124 RepID=A0A2S8GFX3_9BACT|nr:RDD family protein [Blastopirellula marina]PQO43349.1 RDD family protein [Blastopirellula marina]PTL46663.1 RDD family protein [Blastopirellula marina]